MPLTPTGDIVDAAVRSSTGVGAFNVIQLEHAEAIVAAAAGVDAPVILQISQNCVAYHGSLRPIGAATVAVAEAADVPVAVHLDHAESVELVYEAVALGFTSVMFDASKLDYAQNVATTRDVAEFCHEHRIWVEAELGEVGGKDGAHAPHVRTDPAEAKSFVEDTGVDALAVAVGTSHAMVKRDAALDFDLISRLRQAVPVPLVLHGSSGVPDRDLTRAVAAGMTKINIATTLNVAFTTALRDVLRSDAEVVDTRKYLGPARDAMRDEVARLLLVLRGHDAAAR